MISNQENMKSKKTYLIILLILTALVIVILFFKLDKLKETYRNLYIEFSVLSIKESRDSNTLEEYSLLQQDSESRPLMDIELKDAKTKNTVQLSSLLKKDCPVLFFRFKETNCDACILQAIRMLKEIKVHSPKENIVILCGYKNVRYFYAYANEEKNDFGVYNIDSLPLPIDKSDNPYFFIMTNDRVIRNIFIPLKNNRQYTQDYLKCMADKYW